MASVTDTLMAVTDKTEVRKSVGGGARKIKNKQTLNTHIMALTKRNV